MVVMHDIRSIIVRARQAIAPTPGVGAITAREAIVARPHAPVAMIAPVMAAIPAIIAAVVAAIPASITTVVPTIPAVVTTIIAAIPTVVATIIAAIVAVVSAVVLARGARNF
jgi:hypothetical protein